MAEDSGRKITSGPVLQEFIYLTKEFGFYLTGNGSHQRIPSRRVTTSNLCFGKIMLTAI